MAEPTGRLKVVIIQGKSLVIRDFRSSDPYVVVKLGKQKAKTKVIRSCLNPVWNEELSFTLGSDAPGFINFEVFDKDLFKPDDKMGRAYINLQHVQFATRLSKILQMSAGELRKVVPGADDCFAKECTIRCIDGEVVQDVWLRLCGVKSGEIQVRLKYFEE
ncbi:protein C2-DOMAIN ABA-RELATED 11-like [Momordica charantia]|uniref:Protein C2-DOMAIN ABA-RELATED 11-like n=1 Tax=Momordica charantia TaxID=3673 RepID=A0A6J1CLB3_MOMCH|nr:protein C2-DOMAIN ABA-RELATED 11-like [Momordica charantia]